MTMDSVQESLTLPVGNWAIHMLLIIIISQTCKLKADLQYDARPAYRQFLIKSVGDLTF